jgi:hypothetical protein
MLTRGSTGGRVGQDPSEVAPLAPTDHAYAAAVATAAAARAAHLKTIEVVPDQVGTQCLSRHVLRYKI